MKILSTIKQPLMTPTPPFLDNQEFDELLRHSYHNDNENDNNKNEDSEIFICLRDPPITNSTTPKATASHRPSSSDPTSEFFFEFITNIDDLITSSADDLISNGRLLPFAPPPRRSLSFSSAAAWLTPPQLTDSPSESSSLPAIRSSRSLNYRKLHQHHHHRPKPKPKSKSKPKPKSKQKDDLLDNHRCNVYNSSSDIVRAKFPWYWMAFGLPVKIASEMELKDIKNRKFRREPGQPAAGRFVSGGRSCSSSSSSASWKFLSVLSCKSHATVEVDKKSPFRNSFM